MSYGDPEFVLAFFGIVVGIPVVCSTLVTLIHGPKYKNKYKKNRMDHEDRANSDKNQEILEEIFYGLKDLGKRVSNLETILDEKDRRDKYE